MTSIVIEDQPADAVELDVATVLAKTVEIATNGAVRTARYGQGVLAEDIAKVFKDPATPLGAIAPTGTGKSFAYLVPAAVAWAQHGARTLVSTGGLGLQDQLLTKDLPAVAAALAALGVTEPLTYAVRKGWSNYVCAVSAKSSLEDALGNAGLGHKEGVFDDDLLEDLRTRLPQRDAPFETSPEEYVNLLEWAIGPDASERTCAPDAYNDTAWRAVSVPSEECLGTKCPQYEDCPAVLARAEVAEADIVITNHHTVGVQAAGDFPVLLGSKSLGPFDHVVVDEAHALPPTVRSQGAAKVDGRRVLRVVRALAKATDTNARGKWQELGRGGRLVADALDDAIGRSHKPGEPVRKIVEGDELMSEDIYASTLMWCDEVVARLAEAAKSQGEHTVLQRLRSAENAARELRTDIRNITGGNAGWARWVERDQSNIGGPATVCLSPVDVAPLLSNFWRDGAIVDEESGAVLLLSVVALSATLPRSSLFDLGLPGTPDYKQYPSPFDIAYSESAMFVPSTNPLGSPPPVRNNSGRQLDTSAHVAWATPTLIELVKANGGNALVLAATTQAGKLYAGALERAFDDSDLQVISQWSEGNAVRAVEKWRNAKGGMTLVGTRSLMTGVDAPGEMCSLVVIDRVPRAAPNPVDDARVEVLMQKMQIDKWAADRLVYVADAALLLEQAAGRLIRRESDRGVLAVLDPRLLPNTPLSAPHATQTVYMSALAAFQRKVSKLDTILELISAQRRATNMEAA